MKDKESRDLKLVTAVLDGLTGAIKGLLDAVFEAIKELFSVSVVYHPKKKEIELRLKIKSERVSKMLDDLAKKGSS